MAIYVVWLGGTNNIPSQAEMFALVTLLKMLREYSVDFVKTNRCYDLQYEASMSVNRVEYHWGKEIPDACKIAGYDTTLRCAVSNKYLQNFGFLLDRGADRSTEDPHGRTAIELPMSGVSKKKLTG